VPCVRASDKRTDRPDRSGHNAMKRAGIFFVILFGWLPSAYAQSANIYKLVPGDSARSIKFGEFVSAGECFNTGAVSVGVESLPGFAFSAGVDAGFPLTRDISLSVALGYDARHINFEQIGYSPSEVNYNFNYIAIRPELSYSGLLIGVGIGLPVSSGVDGPGTNGSPANLGTSDMNILIELRLGACIPLLRTASGVLDLTVDGSYALTQIASSELTPAGATKTPATSLNNGPLVTAELGLQYLFDLNLH
jgi:hypothetical protein